MICQEEAKEPETGITGPLAPARLMLNEVMTLGSTSLDTESHLGSELCHSGPEALPGRAVTAQDGESLMGSELCHSGPEALAGASVTARKPRILLLLHDLSRTGAPRSGLDTFDAMRDDFDVRVIAPIGGPLEEDCRALGPLDILAEIMPHGRIWQRAYRHPQWRRWLREL